MFQRLFLNLAADLCFCLGGLLLLPVPVEAGPAYTAQLADLFDTCFALRTYGLDRCVDPLPELAPLFGRGSLTAGKAAAKKSSWAACCPDSRSSSSIRCYFWASCCCTGSALMAIPGFFGAPSVPTPLFLQS